MPIVLPAPYAPRGRATIPQTARWICCPPAPRAAYPAFLGMSTRPGNARFTWTGRALPAQHRANQSTTRPGTAKEARTWIAHPAEFVCLASMPPARAPLQATGTVFRVRPGACQMQTTRRHAANVQLESTHLPRPLHALTARQATTSPCQARRRVPYAQLGPLHPALGGSTARCAPWAASTGS